VLGALLAQGRLFLPHQHVAQDGTRVRAHAGVGSFRTRPKLTEALEQAQLHLQALRARMDDPPLREAQHDARERGAMDVLDRVHKALRVVDQMQVQRSDCRNKKRQVRAAKASTTDPEARIMKVSNGGFEPAYNVQMAAVGSLLGGPVTVVGVQVTNVGSDKHSVVPMCKQVEQRTKHKVKEILVDAEHLTHDELLAALAQGCTVIAPVPERWEASEAPQDPAIATWIKTMKTEPYREAYRARKALIEHVNAILKERFGLRQVPVRGPSAVLCIMLLAAVVLNLTQHGLALLT
jgi:hypothetical protein